MRWLILTVALAALLGGCKIAATPWVPPDPDRPLPGVP